jgi:hypothetical protein
MAKIIEEAKVLEIDAGDLGRMVPPKMSFWDCITILFRQV